MNRVRKTIAGLSALAVMLSGGFGVVPESAVDFGIVARAEEDYTEGTYEELTYRNYGDHIEIVGCDKSAFQALIPEKIDDVPVTVIGKDAFKGCTELWRVHLYDTVTTIEAGAFSNFNYSDCIYYSGNEEEWAAIEISDDGNEMFKNAAIVYNIRPNDIIEEHYGFNLIPPTKTEYVIGEELDLTGAQFTGSYMSVSLEGPVAEGDIFLSDLAEYVEKGVLKLDDSEFDNTKPGTYTIYVIYGNAKDSFEVTVKEGEASDYTEGTYETLTYRNYGDHIEIVGCDKSAELVLIPEKIDGVPVTVIGKDAFKGCTELWRVHLYETVTTIEAGAFSNFNYSGCIYYSGNEEEWAAIEISDDGNEMFKKADMIYDVEPDDIVDEYYSLKIEILPRTEYLIGQELDLTDVHISGYYNTEYPHENFTIRDSLFWTSLDEGIKSGDITLDTSEFDNTKAGTYTIYIHWDAHDVVESFEVTVKENLDVDTYEGLTYRNYGDHIEIIDCDETQESVVIPEEINGIPVTAIGDEAFKDCTKLTSIITVGFYDITSIGRGAFENCESLGFIVLPFEIDKISADMFKGCKYLNYIFFESTVKTIEADAFSGCESLEDIYYGGREESWGDVKIEDGNDAFKNAAVNFGYDQFSYIVDISGITLSSIPDKTEYLIGEELDLTGGDFYGNCYRRTMNGTTEEGDIFLTPLNEGIESGIISLDASEFDNTKPGTYTIYIRCDAYDDVESFEVTVKDGEASDYTEGTYETLTYRNYGDHIEIVGCDKSAFQAFIPEKIDGVPVTVIGKDAFKDCTELDRIHLYETVTTIEAGAFSDFNYTDYFHSSDYIYYSGNEEEWAAIEISDDGNEMFKKANVIYDVEPDDIVDGYYSLEIDSRTKYLTGQELDLTDIYVYGYYYTEYLYENSTFRETLLQTSLDEGIKSGDLTLDTSEFDNTKPGTYTIYIHWDAHDVVESFEVTMKENLDVDTYEGLTYRNYGDHIEIIDCDETQESVVIPEELYGIPVTAIGDEAFKDCTELRNIFFNFDYLDPQNITSIGRGAFENCDSLKFIVLTCEIDKISADMFKGCKNLNYIYFRGTVKTIEADAFSGCEILRNIYYGGREEFWGDVKIEDGNDAFKNAAVNFGYNPFSCISEGGSITLCSLPDKTEYLIGEELDLTGGDFIGGFHEVYMDGHEEHGDIFLTSLNEGIEKGWISLDASEFDNTKPGTYTIYIRYDDYDDVESFEVTVKDGEASDYTEGTYETLTYRNYGDHIEIVGCEKSAELILIPEKIDDVPVTVIGKDAFKDCIRFDRIHLYETVTTIESGAFSNFEYSDYIYYSGNEEEWAAIEISDDGNEIFKKADVIYDVEPDDIANEYNYSLSVDSRTEYLTGQELDLTDIQISGTCDREYLYENSAFRETLFRTSLDEGIKSGDITLDASEFDNTKPGTYTIYIHWDAHDVVESFEVTVKEGTEGTYETLTYRNYGDHIEIVGCEKSAELILIPEKIDDVPVTVIGKDAFKDCTKLCRVHLYETVTTIESGAFSNFNYTDFIYYSGNEEEWAAIEISDDGNKIFKKADVIYDVEPDDIIEEYYSFNLSPPTKTEYVIGEELDLTGAQFSGSYISFSLKGPVEEGDIFLSDLAEHVEKGVLKLDASEFDNTKPGTYTIYVIYGNAKDSFEVTVKDGENPTEPEVPLGDLDGNDAINATDAAMVLSAAAAVGAGVDSGLTEEQMKAADVDGNGSFDASDASYILAYAAYTGAGGADSLDEFLESLVEPDVPTEPEVPTEPDNPIVAQLCYENKGGYIEITGCQTNVITELVIPAEIDGVPVKSIANKAFQQYTDLVSVSIADGVTSIGDFAFWNCSGLTSITLPDSIENIGEAAFSNSDRLESIHVSENNKFFKSVDGVLFSKDGTALLVFPMAKTCTSYIIPDGVTTVRGYAFSPAKI